MSRDAKGKFEKGTSGNPGGRPKELAELKELAREHTPMAIEKLAEIAQVADSDAARVAAIKELLDRAWGKAAQAITGEDGEKLSVSVSINRTVKP